MLDAQILSLPMTADYARLAVRLGTARGHSARAVLSGSGIDESELAAPGLRLSQRANFAVLDNLDRLLGPGWPLEVRFGPETSGPLGHAVASAPTVGRAMATLAEFGQSRSPRYALHMCPPDGGRDTLEVVETLSVTAAQRMTGDEIIMLSLHNMLETLVGDDIASAHFAFRSPAPAHAGRYTQAFRGTVAFSAGATRIEFPHAWLERSTPFANPHLFSAALATLEMERTALRREGLLVAEVEHALGFSPGDTPPDLGSIAARLCVSPRTLARRLKAARTSFRALRDASLHRRARQLLGETDRRIDAISAELGYSDPVAFNLACHRWFGMSPRAWRAQQLTDGPRE